MQENKDWLMFANIAVLKTHLKWRAFTFSLNYKKQVFQASIRNCVFLGKNKKNFLRQKINSVKRVWKVLSFEKLHF